VIAGGVFALTGDITRLLAVLVIATPCPLIIAAPVAFVSGMSRVARSGIIIRKPAAFEALERATVVCFDKTGTLTIGEPTLTTIELEGHESSEHAVLAVAAAIEIHSLHPLARALVAAAGARGIHYHIAESVEERIGQGIRGVVDGVTYAIGRAASAREGMTLSLTKRKKEIARFHFADVLKPGTKELLEALRARRMRLVVITGDRQAQAEAVFRGLPVEVYAEQSPEEKYHVIAKLKKRGKTVVMVGDGLNDAPALARADVGIVFSGTENGASIEAADIAVLGHDVEKLSELFAAATRTVAIAKQSIYGGIALSVVGMLVAAAGFLHPIAGAVTQELIDVIVIVNALRALKS
jgi:P-type E1-E2 ATPase